MNKSYKYLAKNVGLLTLSNFATRLLSFFLVPLYTSALTTSEYGKFDIFNTTILLLIPVLTLNIHDAVIRFAVDRETNKKEVLSIGMKYFCIGFVAIIIALTANIILGFYPIGYDYTLFFLLMYASQSLVGILSDFARGLGKFKVIAISSIISSVINIALNIYLLIVLKIGIYGYFIATIIEGISQVLLLIMGAKVWQYIVFNHNIDVEKRMRSYSIPLIANAISWWVNSVSDRYIIVWLCGFSANGLYAIAGKIPGIINIFQNIFSQAWTVSAARDYDPNDRNHFFSNMYNLYVACMVILTSLIIVFDKILARILYANEFFEAWRFVPFLTIAVMFGGLSAYIGGIFTAVKDTKSFSSTTGIGAITNIVLNVITISIIGVMGAAISTMVSYLIVWALRIIKLRSYIRIRFNLGRDLLAFIILFCQSIVMLAPLENMLMYSVEGILFIVIVLLFRKEAQNLCVSLIRHSNSQGGKEE